MGTATDSIQDFVTFSDITDRLRELKETMQFAVARLPDDVNRQMLVACVIKQVVSLPTAPTRWGMSKDMAEMEKVRAQLTATAEQTKAVLAKLEARKEVETIQQKEESRGIVIPEDAEA